MLHVTLLLSLFVCSLKRLLHSRQQGDQTCVAHVLDLHHPLLVRNTVHMTPEVLLVVAGDAAEVAVKLVGALSHTILSFLLAVLASQWRLFDL